MTAYDSVWELITATQAEQLTRTSQCLLTGKEYLENNFLQKFRASGGLNVFGKFEDV